MSLIVVDYISNSYFKSDTFIFSFTHFNFNFGFRQHKNAPLSLFHYLNIDIIFISVFRMG